MKNNILEGEQFSAHLKKLNQFGLNINLNMKKNCYLFGSIVHKHFDRAGNTTRILATLFVCLLF